MPWLRAAMIGGTTGLIVAVLGAASALSQASGPLGPADVAFQLLVGAVIYVPLGIAIAAAALWFRPVWSSRRVVLATALGLILCGLATAMLVVVLGSGQPGDSLGPGAAVRQTPTVQPTPDPSVATTQPPTTEPTPELTIYDQCINALAPLMDPVRRIDTTYSTTGLAWPDHQEWLAEARDAAYNLDIDAITSIDRRCATAARDLGSTLSTMEDARDAWGTCLMETPLCSDDERHAAHDAGRELQHRAREQLRLIDEALDALRTS